MAVAWNEYRLTFKQARYENGRIAILMMSSLLTRYGTLTVNMPDIELEPDEIIIPVWNHPDDLLELILATGEFQDTGKRVFGEAWSESVAGLEAPIWRVRQIDEELSKPA